MQGPKPTDHGFRRLRYAQNRHHGMPVTGPLSPVSVPTVGVGLHLLSWRSPGRSRVPV